MNYLVSKRIPNAEAFLEHCERLSMKSRAIVFRQGDPSEDPEQEMVVSYLNLGKFFGEMGLFGEEHRTANLVTRTPCEFGRISYQDFHAIRQQFPDVLYALTTQVG